MKRIYTLGILSALILGGCQNESIVENIAEDLPESEVFYATIEDNGTKTSLDRNGNVLWKMGDLVSVFPGLTSNRQYKVNDESDGKMSATLNMVSGDDGGTAIANNVAYYPYSASNSIVENVGNYVITCSLPATQNYSEGSFGNGAFPMVAVTGSTSDKNLTFKNVLGGLKLQLKGTAKIVSITVTGNNNEKLYGAATVTAQNGSTPTLALTDASAKTVTLDCGSGVQLNATTATMFIIALPPMTMENGFTVVATDTEGKQMEIKTTKSQTITRSCLTRMPEVDNVGAYKYVDLGLSVKWATMNVGATSPEGYGDYFAWGATETYYAIENSQIVWKSGKSAGYDWSTYKYCEGSYDKITKYCNDRSYGYNNYSDNKTVLDLTDDAAHVNWGGTWRIPTNEEWSELKNKCIWTWKTQNGIYGFEVKSSKNGNLIFLPAAGYRVKTSLFTDDGSGGYWSSTLDYPYSAKLLSFKLAENQYTYFLTFCDRFWAYPIRPVCD